MDEIIICAKHDFRHVSTDYLCPYCAQEQRREAYQVQRGAEHTLIIDNKPWTHGKTHYPKPMKVGEFIVPEGYKDNDYSVVEVRMPRSMRQRVLSWLKGGNS